MTPRGILGGSWAGLVGPGEQAIEGPGIDDVGFLYQVGDLVKEFGDFEVSHGMAE